MAFWFDFDSVNKILLVRFEGRLTEEVMAELYEAIRKYSTATDASAGILDFSSVTEFAIIGATKIRIDAFRDTGGDAASCFTALLETSNFVTAEASTMLRQGGWDAMYFVIAA